MEPRLGETIYGCHHFTECGHIKSVVKHVTEDGMNHFIVVEHFNDRTVRVRREPNGLLYEIEMFDQ